MTGATSARWRNIPSRSPVSSRTAPKRPARFSHRIELANSINEGNHIPRYAPLSGARILSALLSLPALRHAAAYRLGAFAGSAGTDNPSELRAMFKRLADYIARSTGNNVN